jgi:hypothetical protein
MNKYGSKNAESGDDFYYTASAWLFWSDSNDIIIGTLVRSTWLMLHGSTKDYPIDGASSQPNQGSFSTNPRTWSSLMSQARGTMQPNNRSRSVDRSLALQFFTFSP